jgi:heat shock protein HslJ
MRRSTESALQVVVLLALLVAGCSEGSAGRGDSDSAPLPASEPTGDWRLVLLFASAEEQSDLPAVITLTLDGSRGSGIAGCNNYWFVYNSVANSFEVSGGIATTRRACRGQGVMEAEGRFLRVLAVAAVIREVDGRLVLDGPLGMLTFEPVDRG